MTTKKKKSAKPKLSSKSKKLIAKLQPKEQTYVAERLRGKSKMQSALSAGWSKNMARKAGERIETEDVTNALRSALRDVAPIEKIAQVIGEGLDAVETQTFCNVFGSKIKNNQRVELTHVDKIAYSERRQYAALAAKLHGVKGMGSEVEVGDKDNVRVRVLIDC